MSSETPVDTSAPVQTSPAFDIASLPVKKVKEVKPRKKSLWSAYGKHKAAGREPGSGRINFTNQREQYNEEKLDFGRKLVSGEIVLPGFDPKLMNIKTA